MRSLTPSDQLFLQMEKRRQPIHVGGLFLFRPPEGAGEDFVYNLVQDMRSSHAQPVFPFNQVLHKGLFWKEDEMFDIDHHFRHISLPRPGRIRELLVYVSQEHGRLLERNMPLWECHVIEGIEDNRFGIYFKVHHSLVDGVAAMGLVKRAFSYSPEAMTTKPLWAVSSSKTRKNKAPASSGLLETLSKQFATLPRVGAELVQNMKDYSEPNHVRTTQAPCTLFNQSVTSSRRIVAQSYDISRLNHIAKHFGVTMNDVVLGICAGALRTYLIGQQALPDKPLVAFVPVSLRKDNSVAGNQISFMLANLATHLDDPVERLKIISRTINDGKKRFKRMTQSEIINYTAIVYSLVGLNVITGLMPKRQGFNLIISNVPGSREPLYWNGARMDALYPLSIVMDGQALNITLASYVDKVEFCFTACSQAVPKAQKLIDLLEYQIDAYEMAIKAELAD